MQNDLVPKEDTIKEQETEEDRHYIGSLVGDLVFVPCPRSSRYVAWLELETDIHRGFNEV